MRDLYKILELTPDASVEDIKKSYRKLARKEHPDKGGNQDRMTILIEAYKILSDPESRNRYDKEYKLFEQYLAHYHFEINLALVSTFSLALIMPEVGFKSGCFAMTSSTYIYGSNYNFDIFKFLTEPIVPEYKFELETEKFFTYSMIKPSNSMPRIGYINSAEFPRLLFRIAFLIILQKYLLQVSNVIHSLRKVASLFNQN